MHQVYKLHRETHKYLVKPLSNVHHLKTMLGSRFIKFSKKMKDSQKFTTRSLANLLSTDLCCTFGRDISNIARDCKIDFYELTPAIVKQKMTYCPEVDNFWRRGIATELMAVKNDTHFIEWFSRDKLEEICEHICIN